MEKIHKPEEKSYVSEEINVKTWLDEAIAKLEPLRFTSEPSANPEENERRLLQETADRCGLSVDVVRSLEAATDMSNLCENLGFDDEHPYASKDFVVPEGNQLATLQNQEKEIQENRNKLSYRQAFSASLKYKRVNFKYLDACQRNEIPCPAHLKPFYDPRDVVMTVTFCKPYNRPLEPHEIRLGRLMTMDMIFLVRGNTLLTSLKDKIGCLSDFAFNRDISDDLDAIPVYSKDLYPSNFFYINGTFYSDMRHPESVDLSQDIIPWFKRHSNEADSKKMVARHMSDVRFVDLTLRLGQPYVFIHQGCCEHLMIFSDLRLIRADDCQDEISYPMCISMKPKKRVFCLACKRQTARWVTYNNNRLPFDPGFFCDGCYKSFNYDKDGNKIGSFEAVLFHDKSALIY